VHIDAYGNAITNITKQIFEDTRADRSYSIQFGRQEIPTIHQLYNQVDNGDCAIIFNDNGLLEIAINSGNASQLLGLTCDSSVDISFYPPLL